MNQEDIIPYLGLGVTLVKLQGYHLTVKIAGQYTTPERGHLLLNLEKYLRLEVDPRVEVFLEPRGDLNTLRVKLRGVKT